MDSVERRSTALKTEPTLKRLYEIIFEDETALQALYLDATGVEQTVTCAQCRSKALAIAK